jgi:fructose-1,6-bisphosphatase/inositol monophosphatase family enzyme
MALARASALEDWLIDLAELVASAAHKALLRADAGKVVRTGAYGVPTVLADAKAEQVVVDALRDAPIPLNLFSEEVGHIATPGAEFTLVADPIDGTRNAVRRIPFWCVSLAIGRTDLAGMELGVVRDATTGDVYAARKGKGARLNGRRVRVRAFDPKQVIVASALDYEKEIDIPWRPHTHFRDMGSSALEMCLVATGAIDLFLSTKNYLRVVDIAASQLMVREAGGEVYDLDRRPLNAGYGLQERVSLYAMGDPKAWSVVR